MTNAKATPVDDLVRAATDRSGLSDLGPGTWREGLEALIAELDRSGVVTAEGWTRMNQEFTAALVNRQQVMHYAAEHPEVRHQRIEQPLIVLGMPRTGTTVISYLLDQDPARRSLLNWEATSTCPPAPADDRRTDPRCLAKLETQRAMADALATAGRSVPHWEWADGPTECIFLHTQDFKALYWDAMMPTDGYSDWLLDCDMQSAYDYEVLVLQILQSSAPGTWSLKMPSHAAHIETLLTTFPDARMVWAHRDPYEALGSLCSAVSGGKASVTGGVVDRKLVGKTSLTQMRAHVDRAMAARRRIGDDRFFDLHYVDLMADPMGAIRRLYDWAGDTLALTTVEAMNAWLTENPQGKFGRHSYSLDEYGLSRKELRPYFDDYVETFEVHVD